MSTQNIHHLPASGAPEPPVDLARLLHARGLRATPQRLVILRALERHGRHATADEIRGWIREELPGTSTPTLYATLDLLVELGLLRRIDVGAGATLYDPRTAPHQHAVCRRCGRVDDIDGAVDLAGLRAAAGEAGFDVRAVEVVASGLCADCAAAADADRRFSGGRTEAAGAAARATAG